MRLYYSPFACSLAAHIACLEAKIDCELVRVDLATKRCASGEDYASMHPLGQVPTLVLPEGGILTENLAILFYLSDQRGPGESAERNVTEDRYELLRWLSFLATELHKKVLWPIFASSPPAAVKEHARQSAGQVLDVLSAHLESRDFLVGRDFTVADAFLFWGLLLLPRAGIPSDEVPVLRRYFKRHRDRPAIRAALTYEQASYERPFSLPEPRSVVPC